MRRARIPALTPANLLRLALPAALVAAGLIALTGSAGTASQSRPYRPPLALTHTPTAPQFEANSVVVKFKKSASASARQAAVTRLRAKTEDSVASRAVKLTGTESAQDLLKKAKADPAVELASLNYKRWASAVPNDAYYPVVDGTGQASYLNTIRMPQAWDVSRSTGNQVVAVLDTGVDSGHPDLVGRLVPGYNAVSSTRPNPVDDNGHGTMALGIVAASANNGYGVAGIGWAAKAMPVKVLDANGEGYDADIAEGIDWAVAHGATVINMSLAGPYDNPVLHDAVKRAVAAGVVVVAASGNNGNAAAQFPAAYPEVIAVSATDQGGALTDFSSYGDWVDVAAPGWDIVTTGARSMTPAGQDPIWLCTGTSCAAPIIAGVAALVKNKWPAYTPAQVATRLKTLARDAGPRGIDQYYGAGVVDAYAVLGGRWAPDFPVNPADGNDQPSRAVSVAAPAWGQPIEVKGVIGTEGESDWYVVDWGTPMGFQTWVTSAAYDPQYPANLGPVIDVYAADMKPMKHGEKPYPDVDPATGRPQTVPLTANADVPAVTNRTFIRVRNANGSRDARPYTLVVFGQGAGSGRDASIYPISDVVPADLSAGAAVTVRPSTTLALDVQANTVNATTVRLFNGRTGAAVPADVIYDAATRRAVLTPTAPLLDATPYKLLMAGVRQDFSTVLPPISSVFTTADLAPQKLTAFTGGGGYLSANLAWTVPSTPDFDQVVVRRNVGSKAPTPTTGTLVYAGTGTAVKNTGLAQGTTYTYAAWVKDRAGHYGPAAVKQLLGMKSGISVSSTSINYGGSITVRGSTLRIDNVAYAGLPVNVYVRPKNSSKFTLLAALKTSSTGTLSVAHKPLVSSVYMLTFPGNASLMGTRTADVTVQVRPTISATLSPSSIRLGGTAVFSGYVAPAHYGQTVYLQQYGSKVWKSIASVKLSSSGKYAFGIKPAIRGQIAYRVFFPGDADHAPAYTVNKILSIS
ncbi:S8 family serine peptidase [Kribbella sp. NPDC003505]|uniref:S8 family serine peptidase n=1 Tax=Kribbella sp. NPDC003505 TaxID=3154448 RepID=UPI0033A4488C